MKQPFLFLLFFIVGAALLLPVHSMEKSDLRSELISMMDGFVTTAALSALYSIGSAVKNNQNLISCSSAGKASLLALATTGCVGWWSYRWCGKYSLDVKVNKKKYMIGFIMGGLLGLSWRALLADRSAPPQYPSSFRYHRLNLPSVFSPSQLLVSSKIQEIKTPPPACMLSWSIRFLKSILKR